MKQSMKALLAAAAVSGLMAGATPLFASVTSSASGTAPILKAGTASFTNLLAHVHKHSCKGKNNCKGQGGCKSGDNGCKGKNSCKGKGGCATDGSAMPQ